MDLSVQVMFLSQCCKAALNFNIQGENDIDCQKIQLEDNM